MPGVQGCPLRAFFILPKELLRLQLRLNSYRSNNSNYDFICFSIPSQTTATASAEQPITTMAVYRLHADANVRTTIRGAESEVNSNNNHSIWRYKLRFL